MLCDRAKPSGDVAKDGSLLIDCPFSATGTVRDCGPGCEGFAPKRRASSDYERKIRDLWQARVDAALNPGCKGCGG